MSVPDPTPPSAGPTGWQVAERAYAAFDAWLAEQPDELQDLSLLEQIDAYYQAMCGEQAGD